MPLLFFKLLLTPALIIAATYAARRWGAAVSGWIVGLPLTSGPVLVFIAIERGNDFAAHAAVGSLRGAAAQVGFVLAYYYASRHLRWWGALVCGALGFAASAYTIQTQSLPAPSTLVVVFGILIVGLLLVPDPWYEQPSGLVSRYELAFRASTATIIVLLITELAPTLGPDLSGMLATFPVFGALFTVFAHRLHGINTACHVLRGLMLGLFSFAVFFAGASLALHRFGLPAAMSIAVLTAISAQAMTWTVLRRIGRKRQGTPNNI